MRYALNVAPINGWVTHLGRASASMTLAAEGEGQVAQLGSATITMTLAPVGVGQVAQLGQGSVVMNLSTSGIPLLAKLGTGTSVFAMTIAGRPLVAKRGTGLIEMAWISRHGIPRPPVSPDVFSATHKSRKVRVQSESRTIRVEPERPVVFRADRRQVGVPAANRSV
jgi:hypothetical protein